ncbi:putative reverse transcriptase domain-containing protein [Tanacetum coccineum]
MSFASSAVTYTSVYTDSEPGRAFWGADDEEVSEGGIPRVIVYGYDELPIQPTHDPDYMLEPVYHEYIPLEDERVFPAEEQPLPPVDSPTAESPEYVYESDPEEDPEEYEDEEIEDGPVDYHMDGGDDGEDDDDDSYRDGADDEDEDEGDEEDEEEEEEHLASADSAIIIPTVRITVRLQTSMSLPPEVEVKRLLAMPTPSLSPPISLSPPSTREPLARCMTPPAHSSPPPVPSPLLPSFGCPTQVQTLMIATTQALIDAVTASLPSPPLPQLPPSLCIPPPVDRRDDIPEFKQPPCKRLYLSTLGSKYEIRESSTARPTGGRGIDYGFVSTVDTEERRQGVRDVGYGIRDTWVDPTDAQEYHFMDRRHQVNLILVLNKIIWAFVELPGLVIAHWSMFEISGNNFNDWFLQLKMVLRVERKLFVIEQPISLASPTDSEYLRSGMRMRENQLAHMSLDEELCGTANKKSLNAKGKNKVKGKGNDKKVYIPQPKNPKPTAMERPTKDDACHHCKEVGHCKRNCPAYLAELIKKKKQVGTASSSDLTPPYTPQHNGVSERRNRTLLDMVRSMMNLTTLPLSFWDYALESATRILNMVPTKKVDKTPYELWYVVPTGRVKVPADRYVVPTGKDNVIVSAGRSKVIPAGRTILVLKLTKRLLKGLHLLNQTIHNLYRLEDLSRAGPTSGIRAWREPLLKKLYFYYS